MPKRWFCMAVVLIIALPSAVFALGMPGMGGMGGMGGMVGKVYFQTKTVGKVLFNHNVHGGFQCRKCHPRLFKKSLKNRHFTMKAMERGQACGACHNGRRAFSVKSNCTKCHAGDIVFKVPGMGNVTFPHSVHIQMFGCSSCHPSIFKPQRGANKATMADMQKGKSCGACHDGSTAFSVTGKCDSCHKM